MIIMVPATFHYGTGTDTADATIRGRTISTIQHAVRQGKAAGGILVEQAIRQHQLQQEKVASERAAAEAAAAQLEAETPVAAPTPTPVEPQPSGNAAKDFIYQHESGNDPSKVNPDSGACGLGQALPCAKMPCALGDYACQDAFFTQYMLDRYGSWEAAYAFWQANGWW